MGRNVDGASPHPERATLSERHRLTDGSSCEVPEAGQADGNEGWEDDDLDDVTGLWRFQDEPVANVHAYVLRVRERAIRSRGQDQIARRQLHLVGCDTGMHR